MIATALTMNAGKCVVTHCQRVLLQNLVTVVWIRYMSNSWRVAICTSCSKQYIPQALATHIATCWALTLHHRSCMRHHLLRVGSIWCSVAVLLLLEHLVLASLQHAIVEEVASRVHV